MPLHAQKGTIWCALWAEQIIIYLYVFKNEAGQMVTVERERYRVMND